VPDKYAVSISLVAPVVSTTRSDEHHLIWKSCWDITLCK